MVDSKITQASVSVRGIVHAPGPVDRERYLAIRSIGSGGMGVVDEVTDRLLGRSVARKSLRPNADPMHAALLVAEAQVCAQLEHPSIVPVHDLFGDESGPAYTMRVVRGRTLRELLAGEDRVRGRHRRLNDLRQVCLAVEYAHARGVVHRDLKPSNIIVGEFGEVYVLDWGMAFLLDNTDVRRDAIGPLSGGSPGYMAPEQLQESGQLGIHTDVFALGVILYEILCGQRPFANLRATLLPLEKRPREIDSRAPSELDDLAVRCVAADPQLRPASARAIADAIDSFLSGEREREERNEAAEEAIRDGDLARIDHEVQLEESSRLKTAAQELLASIPSWADASAKQPAWDMLTSSRAFATAASEAFARASAAYTRALGQVRDHPRARGGLARLHASELARAEAEGDDQLARQHLALARAYDDGFDGSLPLADGRLFVKTDVPQARIAVARYETVGLMLRPGTAVLVSEAGVSLPAGSHLVTIEWANGHVRAPVMIHRAKQTTLTLAAAVTEQLPAGMILVPGGPFLARRRNRTGHDAITLPDYAIARFPVTLREYAAMLEELDDEGRARRVPLDDGAPELIRTSSGWEVADVVVEGDEARARVPDPLDLPVASITWFDAAAYTRWLAQKTGLAYRLPSLLEVDKAMHGVDGRLVPMGVALDPSFAKLRESRPEASQPEPIGAFPLDESPYCVRDLLGGVTDWTSTFIDGAPAPTEGDEDRPEARMRRAYHAGGCWSFTAYADRLGFAEQGATTRGGWIGFRLALDLPDHSTLVVR